MILQQIFNWTAIQYSFHCTNLQRKKNPIKIVKISVSKKKAYLFRHNVRVRYQKESCRYPNRPENFVDEQVLGDAGEVGNFHLKQFRK